MHGHKWPRKHKALILSLFELTTSVQLRAIFIVKFFCSLWHIFCSIWNKFCSRTFLVPFVPIFTYVSTPTATTTRTTKLLLGPLSRARGQKYIHASSSIVLGVKQTELLNTTMKKIYKRGIAFVSRLNAKSQSKSKINIFHLDARAMKKNSRLHANFHLGCCLFNNRNFTH